MHKALQPALGLALTLMASLPTQAASLAAAAAHLGVDRVSSIEFSGSGRWFQFGQAPAPSLSWPPFDVSRYEADIDFERRAARVQIVRKQVVEPGRERPVPVEQRPDQYVLGDQAWNLAPAPNAQAGAAPVATAQPAALEERRAEIWSTPHGFIKAAQANGARSRSVKGGVEISFTAAGKYRYVGLINSRNEVERVRTWIDNPVLGDTLVETRLSGYRDFGGLLFPARIVRVQGGHPVLDIQVAQAKASAEAPLAAPGNLAATPAVNVTAEKLAEGVHYLRGGTHHSVLIEQRDHLVVVEAPLNEARSQAVIAKAREIAPGKPIRYLVNTHAHFDHSGGVRSYVAEGATIVTHADNIAYYRQAWSAPRTVNPDRLASAPVKPVFRAFNDKLVLGEGDRAVEIHSIAANSHNDAFALVYLPAEKILVEADAWTPVAANAPLAAPANPYTVNLYGNIVRLKLDVERIAALHGPRVATLDDLRAAVNPPARVSGAN